MMLTDTMNALQPLIDALGCILFVFVGVVLVLQVKEWFSPQIFLMLDLQPEQQQIWRLAPGHPARPGFRNPAPAGTT